MEEVGTLEVLQEQEQEDAFPSSSTRENGGKCAVCETETFASKLPSLDSEYDI